jgi:hypothetical protein
MRRLKILTWQTHGSYLRYLAQAPHDFHVIAAPGELAPGRNLTAVAPEQVRHLDFDCILFQDDAQYFDAQHRLLSAAQRALPQIYLEHDPPREHPTDTLHPVQDRNVLLVHVTPFNQLMWDSGVTPNRVVEHGVIAPPLTWSGELERGLTVVNHIATRGRRLGWDIFQAARREVPLDLVGMGEEAMREVPLRDLPRFAAPYRFFFHPVRYTSLGLALIEAMMLGMPVVALATTEVASVIRNGENGFAATSYELLLADMHRLLMDHALARHLGERGRRMAMERFGIGRFIEDWNSVFAEVTGTYRSEGMHHARHAA